MTVLRTYESLNPLKSLGVVAIILAIFIAFLTLYFAVKNEDWPQLIYLIVPVFIALIGIMLFAKSEQKTRYDCLIDENQSFTEICEKYDVIKQDGLIWTLEERKSNETD